MALGAFAWLQQRSGGRPLRAASWVGIMGGTGREAEGASTGGASREATSRRMHGHHQHWTRHKVAFVQAPGICCRQTPHLSPSRTPPAINALRSRPGQGQGRARGLGGGTRSSSRAFKDGRLYMYSFATLPTEWVVI